MGEVLGEARKPNRKCVLFFKHLREVGGGEDVRLRHVRRVPIKAGNAGGKLTISTFIVRCVPVMFAVFRRSLGEGVGEENCHTR